MRFGRLMGVAALTLGTIGPLSLLTACHTGDKGDAREPVQPPQIYGNMPLDKALEAAIDFGGDTLSEVKRLVKHRHETHKAAALVEGALEKGLDSYGNSQLVNATGLYAALPGAVSPALFAKMVASDRPLVRQLGWQIAAVKPSPALSQAIDRELTRALAEGDDQQVLVPQMANAVRANKLTSSYTFVRAGLMQKGDEEFALAMMALDPPRASNDFLIYLAQAPADELRQLTMSTVNLYTCVAILKHMQRVPPDMGAPGFDHLVDYAVSRNTALADLAQNVIEMYVPHKTDLMAQILAKHPAWEQIAYLENVRRRLDPKVGLLLNELKKDTPETDVAQEIDEIKF